MHVSQAGDIREGRKVMRAVMPGDAAGRRALIRREHRAKTGRRQRKVRNGEVLWRGQTLREAAIALADNLKLGLTACSGNGDSGWVIEMDDRELDVTVTYRLALADNLKQLEAYIKANVIPPTWGLRIILRFYFGDINYRNQFTIEFPRTDGRIA